MKKDNYDSFTDPSSPLNIANSTNSTIQRLRRGQNQKDMTWKEIIIWLIVIVLLPFVLPVILDLLDSILRIF